MATERAKKNFQHWKQFLDSARAFFFNSSPPRITENSSLRDVLRHYPQGREVLRQQFHMTVTTHEMGQTLRQLSQNYGLPPPQVLFMEIQLAAKNSRIRQISPVEAKRLIDANQAVLVVDVREPSEWAHHAGIEGAIRCEQSALNGALMNLPPSTSLVLYCHFGVRSLDFAHWLADQGFTSVMVIRGGLDAWSTQVDSAIARYDGSYC